MSCLEVHILPVDAKTNTAIMERLTNLINRAFAGAEDGIWQQGAVRTTVEEVAKITADGEMVVAESAGEIVGCVRVTQIDEQTGEFGLLAVSNEYQGSGAGRALVRFAEQMCKNKQLPRMQLELLMPREGSYPAKITLENWYCRIGYQQTHTEPFDAAFPELAPMLAVPCKFVVFQKQLG